MRQTGVIEGVARCSTTNDISVMRKTTQGRVDMSLFSSNKRQKYTSEKRKAFEWLPIYDDNDMVVGSWYFFWGSVIATIFPIVPLVNVYTEFMSDHVNSADVVLSPFYLDTTYILLMISGSLFTFGSYLFARAFEEPRLDPLFGCNEHFSTDELVAAWMFCFGTVPSIPYSIIYLTSDSNRIDYWLMLGLAILATVGTYFFVIATYPSNKYNLKQQASPILCQTLLCGTNSWILAHVQNDWLLGSWIFFYASLATSIGSSFFFVVKVYARNSIEMYIFGVSVIDSLIFAIGSAYYVAGSYPLEEDDDYNVTAPMISNNILS